MKELTQTGPEKSAIKYLQLVGLALIAWILCLRNGMEKKKPVN